MLIVKKTHFTHVWRLAVLRTMDVAKEFARTIAVRKFCNTIGMENPLSFALNAKGLLLNGFGLTLVFLLASFWCCLIYLYSLWPFITMELNLLRRYPKLLADCLYFVGPCEIRGYFS
jgi:hypothetical protein